ncbi:nodulation protein NfeD [Halobacteriovorax sp. HLS]|uniref:NfeD family protein n=1 Tax=Halobacteriovorax sp. HLS TaxID=2234000 RepID=UPI000FDB56F3|nr:NfeD family protein [Halobacteriovorax sp. HLS]
MISSKNSKTYQITLILTMVFLFFCNNSLASNHKINKVLELNIDSAIGAATLNYTKEGFKKADEGKYSLILIRMNTPGGFLSTTKEILSLIGDSNIPVAIWITPEGASATSAGAIIASASHLLYMSSATNIGAATPIQMSGDLDKGDVRNKAVNDLVALVTGFAQTRHRNTVLYADMIDKASSFESSSALKNQLIDGIANSKEELFKQINGREILVKGEPLTLAVESLSFTQYDMDLGQKLLNILGDPNTSYILFLIGAALLYLEFQAAGGFIAGSIGVIFLVFAGIGFQVLPLNFGALALIALSFVLFVLEMYITSYGILSLGGLASLVSGSLFLFRTDNAYISVSREIIYSSAGAITVFMGLVFYMMVRDQKYIGKKVFNPIIGQRATIIQELEKHGEHYTYQVKVHGEVWKLETLSPKEVNEEVIIESITGLTLKA